MNQKREGLFKHQAGGTQLSSIKEMADKETQVIDKKKEIIEEESKKDFKIKQ